ncbi:MAG: hypothetical protein WCX65_00425 [bacterium]
MGRNTKIKCIMALCVCAFLFSTQMTLAATKAAKTKAPAKATAAAEKYTPVSLWTAVANKWDKDINSYHCKLFSWTYRTDLFIKNFPEVFITSEGKPKEPPKIKWDYRIFDVRFKKPDKALLGYDLSLNENLEEGSLIDRGVAYMLTFAKGTMLNYGYKNDDEIFIVFPYLKDKEFNAMPVPMVWKAAMKLLMIASRKEVYHKPITDMRDLRGNDIAGLGIGRTMKRYEHYFKDGKVSLSKVPLYTREDYDHDKTTGWLTLKKNINRPASIYMITMVPKNVKTNRGITKVETFIDPETLMFVGLQEYENGKLIQVMLFSDLTLNPDLPDKLWDDFFKGRTLSEKR